MSIPNACINYIFYVSNLQDAPTRRTFGAAKESYYGEMAREGGFPRHGCVLLMDCLRGAGCFSCCCFRRRRRRTQSAPDTHFLRVHVLYVHPFSGHLRPINVKAPNPRSTYHQRTRRGNKPQPATLLI
jgi:hypothetical protein